MDDEEANLNAGTKGAEKASLGRTISSHQDLLAAIMSKARVHHFEIARPSLHDIFVRIAGPEAEEATHA